MSQLFERGFLPRRAIGIAGLGQNVTTGIDYGYALRAQAGNRCRHQVLDGLDRIRTDPSGPADIQNDTGLRRTGLGRKQVTVRQDQMDPHIAYAMKQPDGAFKLPFHGACFVDCLFELGAGQRAVLVEQFVTDGAPAGQPLLGQQKPCARDLVTAEHRCWCHQGWLWRRCGPC